MGLVFLERAAIEATFWPLVLSRAASVILVLLLAGTAQHYRVPDRSTMPWLFVAGGLDAAGALMYVVATQRTQ